jgi:hypothetical protein
MPMPMPMPMPTQRVKVEAAPSLVSRRAADPVGKAQGTRLLPCHTRDGASGCFLWSWTWWTRRDCDGGTGSRQKQRTAGRPEGPPPPPHRDAHGWESRCQGPTGGMHDTHAFVEPPSPARRALTRPLSDSSTITTRSKHTHPRDKRGVAWGGNGGGAQNARQGDEGDGMTVGGSASGPSKKRRRMRWLNGWIWMGGWMDRDRGGGLIHSALGGIRRERSEGWGIPEGGVR